MDAESKDISHMDQSNTKRHVNLTSSQSNLVLIFIVGSTEVEVRDAPGRPFE